MRLRPVPVLALLRGLWEKPRDMARFQEYLAHVKGGPDGEIFAPLVAANPMAREHMVVYVDALQKLGADAILQATCAEAERRLSRMALDLKVSLVPIDDVRGAWSERTLIDFENRFGSGRGARDDGYATALVYASETPSAELVRRRVLAACYRGVHSRVHGASPTLRAMMAQEGRALLFAENAAPERHDIADIRARLAPHLEATLHAKRFAAMYGDAAARRVGHAPLGLPDNAGFVVAHADALSAGRAPEDEL